MVASPAPASSAAVVPNERTARLVIRVAGTVAIVLMIVFLGLFPARALHQNLPGITSPILGLELASQPEQVFGILGFPGEAERADYVRRVDLGNELDFLFMIAYPALFFGIALLLGAHGSLARGVVILAGVLAVTMALGDALENRELLFLSGAADPAAMMPSLARLQRFTHVKWDAIFVASALLALGASREAGWFCWSAPFYFIAAVLGLSATFGWLAGIELGMYPLAIGWIMAYVRAWRGR